MVAHPRWCGLRRLPERPGPRHGEDDGGVVDGDDGREPELVAALKAVVPPLTVVSAVAPLTPAVRSMPEGQGRSDEAVEVCRRHEPEREYWHRRTGRAEAVATTPTGFHVRRRSSKSPAPFAVAAAVKAIPSTAAVSMSVIRYPPALAIRSVTSDPRCRSASPERLDRHATLPDVRATDVIDRVDRDRECLRRARIHSAVCGSPIVLESHCHDRRSIRVRRRGKRERVLAGLTAGRTANKASLFVVTRKERTWPFSSAGPRAIPVAHPATVCRTRHPRSRTGRRPSRSWAHR